MRHCMIVFAVYPLGETRVQREAEVLVNNGYEVDVICTRLPEETAEDAYKGVRIFRKASQNPFSRWVKSELGNRFLSYLRFFLAAGWLVTRLHFQKRYDSIQVHNLPDFLVFCALIPKLMGVPVILDLHDLMPEFFAGRFGKERSLGARLIRLQERLSCRFADHVITVSEHWRQALIQRGVPPEKCSVVMNVADDQIFFPGSNGRSTAAHQHGFGLIYHGGVPPRYGLDLAIQAVNCLRAEIPGIHLKIICRGENKPNLEQLVKDLALEQHVSFDDLYLAEELPAIIQSYALGIVPYLDDVFTGGLLPTKLMEYAALGMPAIASRTPAIETYFRDANVAFFEPGSVDDLVCAVRDLYHNPSRLAELAAGSEKFNRRYNWKNIGAEYLALVDRLKKKSNHRYAV